MGVFSIYDEYGDLRTANPPPGLGGSGSKGLSDRDKRLLAIAGGTAVVALGVALILRKPKPEKKADLGIKVAPQCNTFEVTNEGKVRDGLRKQVDVEQRGNKGVSPFEVASGWLGKITDCQTFPANARNPGEATLYIYAFVQTLDVMREQNLISDSDETMYKQMIKVWGLQQGLTEDQFQ